MRNFFIQKEAGSMCLLLQDKDSAIVTIHKKTEDESKELHKYIKSKALIKIRKEFFNKGRCIDVKKIKKDCKNIKLCFLNNDSSKFDVAIKISIKSDKNGKIGFSIKPTFSNVVYKDGTKLESPNETKIINLL